MQGKKKLIPQLFYHQSLDEMVPEDNFYRKVNENLSLNFLYKVTAPYYGKCGQESIDPVVFFKILMVGYLNNINSDRSLIRFCSNCLDIRLFLGYDLNENLPFHSTISRTRSLFGEELFLELFRKVLILCVGKGMVRGKRMAVDSAFIKANASMDSLVEKEVFGSVKAINRQTVKYLKKQLSMLDDKIKKLSREDEVLYKQQQLLKSIPGIGEITSVYLLMVTKGFTAFTNGRKFACYSGVAPFEHTSGTSIKGKTRVSHLADKKMKSLLHMVSLTAIKYDPELKEYYTRKKAEGKHTMLVLNNIKCKIVYRIFAVIQRESNFVNLHKFAA